MGSGSICKFICLYDVVSIRMVNLQLIERIANSKGLLFDYVPSLGAYATMDKVTGMMLAEYADISVQLMTERAWREEFNKLKASKYK